jgi:hypothetical protein
MAIKLKKKEPETKVVASIGEPAIQTVEKPAARIGTTATVPGFVPGVTASIKEPELKMQPPPNTFGGVDLNKPFSTSDFATKQEYEQAKLRATLPTAENIAARQILDAKKAAEVAGIVQQQRMASLDPNLISQAGGLGAIQPYTPEQYNPLNIGQALKEGATQAAIGAGAGALTGAAAGSIVPGVGTVAGGAALGAVGGIGGFIKGTVQSLRQQTSGNLAASYSNLADTKRNLRMLAQDTNMGGDAAANLESFQAQLQAVDEAYAKIKLYNQHRPLDKDATVEMAKFENFYAAGGSRQYLINEMQQAVLNPNPAKQLVTLDDFS